MKRCDARPCSRPRPAPLCCCAGLLLAVTWCGAPTARAEPSEPVQHDEVPTPEPRLEAQPERQRHWQLGLELRVLENEGNVLPWPWLHVSRALTPQLHFDLTGSGLTDGRSGIGITTIGLRYGFGQRALVPFLAARAGIMLLGAPRRSLGLHPVAEAGVGLSWAFSRRAFVHVEAGPLFTTLPDRDARWLLYGALGVGLRL